MHEQSTKPSWIYEDDVNFSIELTRRIFKSICAWPESSQLSWSKTFLRRTGNTIYCGLLGFLLITCSLYLLLEVERTYDKIILTGPLNFCFMAAVKYGSLIFRQDDFRRCFEHIELDWMNVQSTRDREIMLESAKFGRRLVTIYALFMYGGALFYYIAVPFTTGKVQLGDQNLTYWPLVYPVSRIIVDARYSPYNEIIFSAQCLTGFFVHSITVAACSVAAVLAMHACGQMNVIQSWLIYLLNEQEAREDAAKEGLVNIVKYHTRTLSFISDIEDLLNKISFVEVCGCTLNLCLLGYYCIMEWDFHKPVRGLTYSIILVSVCMNIFIFCYIGELLNEQCKRVGEMSYMIEWYRLPAKDSLSLILIMAMSNSTTKLTAGNFIELSLRSFGDVIKASVTYLNMLRKMTSV